VTAAEEPRFDVRRLGEPTLPSPLQVPSSTTFVGDDARILARPLLDAYERAVARREAPASFEIAGPRPRLFFDPATVRAAIATCGGISPGLNTVIRALVIELVERYGVREVVGVRHGYQGLAGTGSWMPLTVEEVDRIHNHGGTVLGTSRGTPPVPEIVDTLVANGIDLFFAVGGDGTLRGAREIASEVGRRGLPIAVVGLPKTIDNDIPWVRRSFGFETAVSLAAEAIRGAWTEATAVRRGVGLVKLMGRHSGYLAASATLATGLVDVCLVPESRFGFDGPDGLVALLERRLDTEGHVVVVVAEGAGQQYFDVETLGFDASGNRKLGDIGALIRERLEALPRVNGKAASIKYIDPSYLVRSAPPRTDDALHATRFAQNAVHAAMSGRTALLIGYWHGMMTHVPLDALTEERRGLNPFGELWWNVLESTGQPLEIGAAGA